MCNDAPPLQESDLDKTKKPEPISLDDQKKLLEIKKLECEIKAVAEPPDRWFKIFGLILPSFITLLTVWITYWILIKKGVFESESNKLAADTRWLEIKKDSFQSQVTRDSLKLNQDSLTLIKNTITLIKDSTSLAQTKALKTKLDANNVRLKNENSNLQETLVFEKQSLSVQGKKYDSLLSQNDYLVKLSRSLDQKNNIDYQNLKEQINRLNEIKDRTTSHRKHIDDFIKQLRDNLGNIEKSSDLLKQIEDENNAINQPIIYTRPK